jgi:hypothetical protein
MLFFPIQPALMHLEVENKEAIFILKVNGIDITSVFLQITTELAVNLSNQQ